MEITVAELREDEKKSKWSDPAQLGFGRIFTDRMLVAEWERTKGWSRARIERYSPFHLEPSTAVFHYAQEVFEGLKAYRWPDGTLALFRPEMNLARLNRSADRLSLPEVPADLFLDGIEQLVRLERDWIPTVKHTSLYIRPALIATETALGVKPADQCRFFVILSPVSSYFKSGFKPVSILVEDRMSRAVPGGTGEAKTGANYAASLKASELAKAQGYDQVLWLDAMEHRWVEEVGAMNIFFVIDGELITPSLSGSFLAGVTRDSLLRLAPTLGIRAVERPVSVEELLEGIRNGRVEEVFGTGTAAVVAPVATLGYQGETLTVGNGGVGKVSRLLYETLTGIQYGEIADRFGWMRKL